MKETASAPRIKAALLTIMEATPAFIDPETLVSYAHPGALDQRVLVYFDRTVQDEKTAGSGMRRREEDVIIDLIIDVFEIGDNPQQTEERCWTLVAEIEKLLREKPEVPSSTEPDGVVVGWVEFVGVEVTPYIQKSQRYVEAICKIHAKNRK